MNKKTLQKDLLTWYDSHQRILPWRDNLNPYYILVSEIMLQQTKVQTVIPYFERFIKKFPTIEDLAKADENELLKHWEGLGYYNRVRNLQKAAKQIVTNYKGIVPKDIEDLQSLSGIGPYTAGAVSSIAYNQKHSAVDGNVLRVFSRLLEIKQDIKNTETKKSIKAYVQSILPSTRIGDFNQALMEIGAIVCIPNGTPHCKECPFNKYCKAYQHHSTSEIPIKRTKKKVPIEEKTVLLLEYKGNYAIEKRDSKGLLASMYQFPMMDYFVEMETFDLLTYGSVSTIEELGLFKHKFTHKEWLMKGYYLKLESNSSNYEFVSINKIDSEYSFPTAFKEFKKIVRRKSNE